MVLSGILSVPHVTATTAAYFEKKSYLTQQSPKIEETIEKCHNI